MPIQVPLRPGAKPLPLSGVKIMVNPGHGERDANGHIKPGAIRKLGKKKIKEMNLNDAVARDVKRKLEKLGASVFYLDNVPVKTIPAIEDREKPKVFVAIHQNAGSKTWCSDRGEGVYAWQPEGMKIAKCINKHFKDDNTIRNTGLHVKRASQLKVLKANASIPAVLVECGFMSNKKELNILNNQNYQNKEAQFIVEGIRDFLTLKKNEAKIIPEVRQSLPLFFKNKKVETVAPWLIKEKPVEDI